MRKIKPYMLNFYPLVAESRSLDAFGRYRAHGVDEHPSGGVSGADIPFGVKKPSNPADDEGAGLDGLAAGEVCPGQVQLPFVAPPVLKMELHGS